AVASRTPANLVASSGSPMTPVDARKTSSGRQPDALAAISAVSSTAAWPLIPVKALALPEFTTSARADPLFRATRHQSTGAEGHLERVNTPATIVPGSNKASSTSVRPWYRMPASAVASRTPAMAGRSGKQAGARGDGGAGFAMGR